MRRTDKAPRTPYQIHITPEARNALRKWAYENDRPASEAIELMITRYLDGLTPEHTA